MATLLLASVGASIGANFSGAFLGLSGAIIGRAAGAALGRVIDQRVLGVGSAPVDVGKTDRFFIMGAGEGSALARTWGRNRLSGNVIWASPFRENTQTTTGGGKGGGPSYSTTQYSYSASLAVAVCEGEILGIGRIWADGKELSPSQFDMRVYHGNETQLPDPVIELDLGAGNTPAYRGVAYVVIENLDLSQFGNRVPQFSFEVLRQAQTPKITNLQTAIQAVALIPGTGEYALSTQDAYISKELAHTVASNVNSRSGKTDFLTSLDQLNQELPHCGATSLVVSWFGDDLRCNRCEIRPKVENSSGDARAMPWRAGGIARSAANVLPVIDGHVIYGGTPSDASVIEAIQALKNSHKDVMFYPFVLMTQIEGNRLPNPYGGLGQPKLPWRGRITLSVAPGGANSPDGTQAAVSEVASFFGDAQPDDFRVVNGSVQYSGSDNWGYRRFILHYAHLCKLAGGVESFCIGSELRGITWIRGPEHSFPAVSELIRLARDVRSIMGQNVKISYAADWSEYFGYHTGNNVYYHLDSLWADDNIDFVGIDNYMPLSDWREGEGHKDYKWGSIYNLEYLKSNVAGGEGYDWYYDGSEGRNAQLRKPIQDGAHDEPWIYRYKDIYSWWSLPHHSRKNGVRDEEQTDWIPRSKPIRFTEYGCPAVDKGTNEPNKFVDAASSESSLPYFSIGISDDYIQMQYYRAVYEYWANEANNPQSPLYNGRMLDLKHCYAWAWDTRPYPEFPRNTELWVDGDNYQLGHWLNGRVTAQPLESVVTEISKNSGVEQIDANQLYGAVQGYSIQDISTGRSALQPLSMVYAFDPVEADGELFFRSRALGASTVINPDDVALASDLSSSVENIRLPSSEVPGRVRLAYIDTDGSYGVKVAESLGTQNNAFNVSEVDVPLLLSAAQAKNITERWLAESQSARELIKLRLPPSNYDIKPSALIEFKGVKYRIDRVETDDAKNIEAVRVETAQYKTYPENTHKTIWKAYKKPSPVQSLWLDLPNVDGNSTTASAFLAASANPWPGQVSIWEANEDAGYSLSGSFSNKAIIGVTETPLAAADIGVFDRGAPLRVRLASDHLTSVSEANLLNGSNFAAIGNGDPNEWEIFQFEAAKLVGVRTYEISMRLRGQLGTDFAMQNKWPVGSYFVLLDRNLERVELSMSRRNIQRHYRVGAAQEGFANNAVSHEVHTFKINSLRPYSVAHLKAKRSLNDDLHISWIRRTRVNGDDWETVDVPIGEENELYRVSIYSLRGTLLHSELSTKSTFIYTDEAQTQNMAPSQLRVEVAQISNFYGAGPTKAIIVS